MDIREHHLTGLLFIKMIPQLRSSRCDNDTVSLPAYRIVCSNELGMTYFDLEVAPGVFRLNYCFEPLNKNALWRILETDFRLLLSPEAGTTPIKTFVQEESNYLVCKSKQGGISRWDLYSPMGDTLLEVRGKSSLADPSWISYAEYHREFPFRINISNPLIKLKLSLSLLSLN